MMKKNLFIGVLLLSGLLGGFAPNLTGVASAQEDKNITPNGVIGEVTAIDPASKSMTIKTDAGNSVSISLSDQTSYMRVPPGETTLAKATRIAFTDINTGDRVFARGKVADDKKSVPARVLIVMTKTDIAQKHERDRAEWQRRGVSGPITAINPTTKEITISTRSREGAQPVVVAAGQAGNVTYRRYAPNSVKFSDAKPGTFEELKVGDQLRALGEKSADGARLVPEEIVSGTFRTLSGTVTAVNPQTNEVKIKTFTDNKEINVSLNQDSLLRRLPPQMAEMMAMRAAGGGMGGPNGRGPNGGGPNAGPSGAGPRGDGAANGQQRPGDGGPRREGGGPPPGGAGGGFGPGGGPNGGGPGGGGFGGGGRRGGFDIQEMLERLPAQTVADLKTGDVVLFSSTVTNDPTHATAITMIAGLDAFANMMRQGGGGPRGGAGGGMGPGGAPPGLDLGIGLP